MNKDGSGENNGTFWLKFVLVVCCAVATMGSVSGQMARSEYFAVLPFWESPLTPFRGAVPISPDQAKGLLHLKLDYDNSNRVVQAQVRLGSSLKAFEGRLGNLYINAPLTRVRYEGKQEIHTFHNRLGEQISVMQGVHRKVYHKDDYGRNVRLTFLDTAGAAAKDFFGIMEYTWQHRSDGSVIEERFDDKGAMVQLRGQFLLERTRIVYGPDGYPAVLQNVDEQGDLTNTSQGCAYFKYFYDEHGRFVRWEVYDQEHNPVPGPSGTCGEQNDFEGYYLSNIRFFDGQGNPTTHWSGVERWHSEYDRYGNKTQLVFQDAAGNLKNGYNGYAKMVFEWSEDGRFLISQTFLDEAGIPFNLKNSGFAKVVYQRDDQGEVQSTLRYKYVDQAFVLVEE